MNEDKQDNVRDKLQEEITGKILKCPSWQVLQPSGTLSYLTRTGLGGEQQGKGKLKDLNSSNQQTRLMLEKIAWVVSKCNVSPTSSEHQHGVADEHETQHRTLLITTL